MKLTTTMLIIWIGLVLAVASYDTFGDEVEFRVTKMEYRWGEDFKFPVTAYQVGYTKHYGNIGLRLMIGQSDKRHSTVESTKHYGFTNQLRNFAVFNAHRNVNLGGGFKFQYGVNYTEYKGGKEGRTNSDTGFGHAFALQYDINQSFAVKLSYDEYYDKYKKEDDMREITRGTGVSLVGMF